MEGTNRTIGSLSLWERARVRVDSPLQYSLFLSCSVYPNNCHEGLAVFFILTVCWGFLLFMLYLLPSLLNQLPDHFLDTLSTFTGTIVYYFI